MRLRLPLRLWLVLSHLVVLLLPVFALLLTRALAYDLRDQTRRALEYQGVLLAMLAADEVADARKDTAGDGLAEVSEPLTSVLRRTKQATLAGIRLVDAEGVVVVSSGDGLGQDLSADAEVRDALREGKVGVAVRPRPGGGSASMLSRRSDYGEGAPSPRTSWSGESRHSGVRLFVTVPILLDDELLGAVVMSRTPREEVQAIYQMAPRLWWGAVVAVLLTIALAVFYGSLFSRSLRSMARAAPGIAQHPGQADRLLARAQRSHVAEVAATADALIATANRLDERLAYIGEFAANVSHEFKTPLSTLRGTVELLQDDEDMPAEQRARFLANAQAELARLERLVSGLLALARAEQADRREAVDLDALLGALCERYPGTQLQGRGGSVHGDPEQLDLALANLIANAHTYGEAPVEVRVTRRHDAVIIDVIDQGTLSEANREQVFERFFTTHRGRGGTGLGLALVRAVAQAHGGEVRLHPDPSPTRFQLRLAV